MTPTRPSGERPVPHGPWGAWLALSGALVAAWLAIRWALATGLPRALHRMLGA